MSADLHKGRGDRVPDLIRALTCLHCNRIFTSTSRLERHLKVYQGPHFFFSCCNERFEWSKDIKKHSCPKQVHCEELSDYLEVEDSEKSPAAVESRLEGVIEATTKFRCNHCPAVFLKYQSIKAHILKYPGKHDFKCDKCEKTFTTEQSLYRHLCFLVKGRFQCSCLKYFYTFRRFKVHAGKHRPYFCCACQNKSASLNNLINHIRTHTKEKPFGCDICQKTFRVRESLTLHKKVHDGEKPFHCSKCYYSSTTKWNLLLHEKRHNIDREEQRKYICEICTSSFFLKHHLRRHIAMHTGENSNLCRVCGKLFRQDFYMKRHMEKHSRDSGKGRKCGTCGKDLMKTELYQHQVETGHFQFVCHPCCKIFFSKFNLERHRKSHR